jgi:hypothetical protein
MQYLAEVWHRVAAELLLFVSSLQAPESELFSDSEIIELKTYLGHEKRTPAYSLSISIELG